MDIEIFSSGNESYLKEFLVLQITKNKATSFKKEDV